MPLISCRARVPGRGTGLGLLPRLCLSPISANTRSRAPWLNHTAQSALNARRFLNNEVKNDLASDLLRSPLSIEDIRLKSEFEENRDIRDYLSKWQEVNSNILDPVRGPETSNPNTSGPWVGDMMNDNREVHEAGSDRSQREEDMSEFSGLSDEGEGMADLLEPGDLVAMDTTEGILRFAVYVRSISKQQQFYTERGKWRIAYHHDIHYVAKGFVPPELLTSLHPYFPASMAELHSEMQSAIEGGIPREAGSRLLQEMNEFRSQVQELYRANSTRFDRIYDIVADESEPLLMTLDELACKALDIQPEQLNDVIRYSVCRAAHQVPFLIAEDRSSLLNKHFMVAPKPVAELLDTVNSWVHEHQNYLVQAMAKKDVPELKNHPLQKFVQKAQRLIQYSRKVRAPTTMASVGPTSARFQPGQDDKPTVYREKMTEQFSAQDCQIIRFLQLWCIPPRNFTTAALRSAGSHIMRATGMYTALDLHATSAPLFLQELGVFTPWENLHLLDKDLGLPGHGINPSAEATWENVQRECEKLNLDGLTDKMASLRKDWGDLPVYCVDSPDAEEIDDGVSLERIPGSNDTFWIRVHIANPSAFLDHDHTIMKYAESRIQTLYVPERTYPMLPKSLTQGHFSLAPGRPTLTFSAKMNINGEVLDTDVSNGIARNVVYVTHDKLSSMLGGEGEEAMKPLVVGGQIPNMHSRTGLRDQLSSEEAETFRTLRKLMLAFREQRLKNGAIDYPAFSDTVVSVSTGAGRPEPTTLDVKSGRYILGDPIIQLNPKKVDPHEVPDMTKQYLISTLMNFGCWVSAKWCAERNIPAVYDGTYYHPEYPHLTNQNISQYGGKGWLELGAPKGVSSSHPIRHVALGLDTYTKSTSPLRRYSDIIAHQQIEAALRFEHEHGRRLDAATPSDAAALPFSHNDIENYISRSFWKRSRLQKCDKSSKQFWACMLLFRAFYFAECELPETFECILRQPLVGGGDSSQDGYAGVITSLGVRCHVMIPPGLGDVDFLTLVEAKITEVNVSRTLVTMEATRVIKPYERVGEWA
ncbi:hypothetical protein BJX61DRAFT_536328 [Aspergillus egyptiacus]|nr:hypothetical protein BJX61DRAFT_536328 [Aspergillus egyptiacus]